MIPESDLDEIIQHSAQDLAHFAGQKILVTGGTGFVGTWIRESIAHANKRLGVGIQHLSVNHVGYDYVVSPEWDSPFDAVIHCAPVHPFEILRLADKWGGVPVLYTSSGAVNYNFSNYLAYTVAKCAGEAECMHYGNAKIARLYTFLGPGLPANKGYAAADFIADAKAGRDIVVKGNPHTRRSWMYPTDMVENLWSIFARGQTTVAYDVGSFATHEMWDFAWRIAQEAMVGVKLTGKNQPATEYAPKLLQPVVDLHLEQRVKLDEAIRRTLNNV